MIRIQKPTQTPAVLLDRGVKAARQFCEHYNADSEAYKNGSKQIRFCCHCLPLGFRQKRALEEFSTTTCTGCESKVTHIGYGDVEHFRAKAAYRQEPNDPLVRPGYYWLAYDWSNLLFCCQLCNQRFKRNHFPLTDPSRRAKSHNDDVGNEQPLLINPAVEDPAEFLEFRENLVHPIGNNARGQKTIEVFGLNRKELEDHRLICFLWFRMLVPLVVDLLNTRREIEIKVNQNPSPELTRDYLEINAQIEQFVGESRQYAQPAGLDPIRRILDGQADPRL